MHELSDLLESTRPDPARLHQPDLDALVRRARRHDRVTATAVGAGALTVAVAIGLTVTSLAQPERLPRPDVAAAPDAAELPRVGGWTQVETPLPPRRSALVEINEDGRVVVFGGAEASGDGNANAWRSDGAIYDPDSGEWTAIPPAPRAPELASGRFGQASLAGGRLLTLATDGQGISGTVYDLADARWTTIPTTDELGQYAQAVTWDGQTLTALQLGHGDGDAGDPTLLRWEFGDDRWTQGAQPPTTSRNYSAVAHHAGKLFVWGGTSSQDTTEAGQPDPGAASDGLLYDNASDAWTSVPAAPIAAGMRGEARWLDDTHVALISNDGIVSGGDAAGSDHQLAIYDTTTGAWELIDPSTAGFDRPFFAFTGDTTSRDPSGGTGILVALDANRPQSFPVDPWAAELAIYDPATDRWTRGPDGGSGHLIRIGEQVAATTAAEGNPGDHAFQVIVRTEAGWRIAADADMRNRMDAGFATTDDRLYLFGGMAGRSIELRSDLWILDLSAEAPTE